MSVQVETQGISPDFGAATGSYDVIEYGEVTEAQLVGILQRLAQLPPLHAAPGADLCPPAVTARGPEGVFSFTHDGSGLYCLEAEEYVDPVAGAAQAFGAASRSGKPRKRRPYPKGRQPVRYPELEPTSPTLEWSGVDRSAPAFVGVVGSESASPRQAIWIAGILLAVGLLLFGMLVSSGEWNAGGFGAGLLMCAAGSPLMWWGWSRRNEHLAAGFDWRANALWVARGGRNRLLGEANCIAELRLSRETEYVPGHDQDYQEKWWAITARYAGDSAPVTRFKRRGEGERVLAALQGALGGPMLASPVAPPVEPPVPGYVPSPQAPTPAVASTVPPAMPAAPTGAAGTCTNCGSGLPPGARFCEQCGAPASASCPHCGRPVKAGARFCGTCGGPMGA